VSRKGDQERKEPLSPDLYTHEYFTTDCEGYDLFVEGSPELSERIKGVLEAAGDLSGKRVLDIGCGRGELACAAAARGAEAVGIDYSQAGIELSRERLQCLKSPIRDHVEFERMDAKDMDFPAESFDVIFMIDVYEHLHDYEIEEVLSRSKRFLRPGGVLIIHTGPNTWFYDYGYPIVRFIFKYVFRRQLPETLRGPYDAIMHVNEQNPLSLYRDLKRYYKASVTPCFFGTEGRPLWKRVAMRVSFARPLGYLFCNTLLARARLPESAA
jgi:cyclopropane fatty-acyl-phospholipid synthase-like methyltransferase